MKKFFLIALAITQTACQSNDVSKSCTAFSRPALSKPKNSIEQIGVADTCVNFESYRLASAPGSAREIAEAVTAGCEASIERYYQMSEKESGPSQGDKGYFLRQAIYRVTEARALHCPATK